MPLSRPAQLVGSQDDEPPLARMGRWDGASFRPVRQGSVEPTRVHVIVHGWAPGWRVAGEAPAAPAWSAWRAGRRFDPWMHRLASALGERDPHAAIIIYSWLDDAATSQNPMSQRRAFARTSHHGRGMAEAIAAMLSSDFHAAGGQVHLIGHSFGARIATIAATSLERPPRHLTILDAPEAGYVRMLATEANLDSLLGELHIGNGPGETFVDNYISMVGRGYRTVRGLASVVDVETTPPNGAFAVSVNHVWAAEFYARTAWESFGIGWSPLLRGSPPVGCFRRPYDRLALEPVCS